MPISSRVIALTAIAVFLLGRSVFAAKEHRASGPEWRCTEQRSGNPVQDSAQWDDISGHRVAVEGVAWGSSDKGLGQHVFLHEGIVYVDGDDVSKLDADGKIVRVVGTLRIEHVKKSPPTVQGYAADFDAFIIKPDSVKVLDRLNWPWMEDLGKAAKH